MTDAPAPHKKRDLAFLWLVLIIGAWLIFYIISCLAIDKPTPRLEPEDVPAAVYTIRIEIQQLRSRIEALEKRQP